ncbi:Topoisomerase 1-associated factor 1 [Elasticomyces elasticus]|nr:Topoisomerase 1-associated factor 1 [Elasticomyces elasticus]
MELYEKSQTVDPEVRAYIYSLVSAVGGSSTIDDGRYVLGDDAFACLKDLNRWLRLYDEKTNRLDVKRCLAETNFVKNDLLEILAQWPETATEDRLKSKIALACLELLVPLTWPIELEDDRTTINHHRHLPYLQLAQVGYKRAVLQHDTAQMLRAAVRIALPSMALPRSERSAREEGIIKLLLYFIRNIAMISQPQHLPSQGDETEVSRSSTIDAFYDQDVLSLVLAVSSSMGDEFVQQDVVILEILFHLVKGVDVEKLFMDKDQVASADTQELKDLMQKEKAMLAGYAKHAPTRHNRFGTMIWVKRDNDRVSTVTGQGVITGDQTALYKMDASKKWNKPKHRGTKAEESNKANDFSDSVSLTGSARHKLRSFVTDFLDSSFNPLFTHIRKALEREADRVQAIHSRQYFYLVSWFLQADSVRRSSRKPSSIDAEDNSFVYIAGVLNQETFILLNRTLQRSFDEKNWQDLNAEMRCFTRILLTVQEMSMSASEDDQEIAENIQNRIFYEETTHDRVVQILRSYKDQGFGYLDACTELAHVFLRNLERYSKQNVDLQVRSKRRARRKNVAKLAKTTNLTPGEEADANNDGAEEEAEDEVQAFRAARERKFDFARFSARFTTQACVDTFVALTRYYNDLSTEQLKRAHRFFYRLAFRLDSSILLFRVDILHLFHGMIKGLRPLEQESSAYKEWEELVKQVFRRCIKKLQERKELAVEMLFSKIPATVFFLEHGYDREVAKRTPRAPAELEMKSGLGREEQIGVAVSVLINQGKLDALEWVKDVLASAVEERQSWHDAEAAKRSLERSATPDGAETEIADQQNDPKAPSIAVKPKDEDSRIALYKDKHLRLLLKVLDFQRLGLGDDSEASWIVPSSLSVADLRTNLDLIKKYEYDPPTFEEGKPPESFIRSAAAARRTKRAFESDSEDGTSGLDEAAFEPGGPTARPSDAAPKAKRRRLTRRNEGDEIDDEERERRAEARRRKEAEKNDKIKSALRVSALDDESDEEADAVFFALEEERRKKMRGAIRNTLLAEQNALAGGRKKNTSTGNKIGKGKKSTMNLHAGRESDDDDVASADDNYDEEHSSREASARPSSPMRLSSDDGMDRDTPLSSRPSADAEGRAKATLTETSGNKAAAALASDDEGDDVRVARPARRPLRAGFVIDSDSE